MVHAGLLRRGADSRAHLARVQGQGRHRRGVDVQDKEEAAREFLAKFNHSFPNAPDPKGRVSVDYGVYGVPETFFIDRKGRVRFKVVGGLTDETARHHLDALLKEPS